MTTAFVAGEIVCLDDNSTVMYTIVHVKDDLAWIEPYAFTADHKHFSTSGECYCGRNDVINTARLWKAFWFNQARKV